MTGLLIITLKGRLRVGLLCWVFAHSSEEGGLCGGCLMGWAPMQQEGEMHLPFTGPQSSL